MFVFKDLLPIYFKRNYIMILKSQYNIQTYNTNKISSINHQRCLLYFSNLFGNAIDVCWHSLSDVYVNKYLSQVKRAF